MLLYCIDFTSPDENLLKKKNMTPVSMWHLNYKKWVNASEIAISFCLVLFFTNKNISQTGSCTHHSLKIAAPLNWLIFHTHTSL